MKTYRDVETFEVRVHDLQFEECFIPMTDFSFENLQKIKVFLHIVGLKHWAAGKVIRLVPGIPGVRPTIYYVREGFGNYIPCSTNKDMDEFTRSLVTQK